MGGCASSCSSPMCPAFTCSVSYPTFFALSYLPYSTKCHYFLLYIPFSVMSYFHYLVLLYSPLPCLTISNPFPAVRVLSTSNRIPTILSLPCHRCTQSSSSGSLIPLRLYSSLFCQPRSTHALQSNIKLMAVDNP